MAGDGSGPRAACGPSSHVDRKGSVVHGAAAHWPRARPPGNRDPRDGLLDPRPDGRRLVEPSDPLRRPRFAPVSSGPSVAAPHGTKDLALLRVVRDTFRPLASP